MRVPEPATRRIPSISDKLSVMRAVVDIGSNTIKVLIAETRRSELTEIGSLSKVARLAQNLSKGSPLHPDAIARAQKTLQEIHKFIKDNGPMESVDVLATASLRKASNPEVIETFVESLFGTKVQIISGLEEARLSMIGARLAVKALSLAEDQCVFFDLGGASTEISTVNPKYSHSFEIGAVSAHSLLGFPSNSISDSDWLAKDKKLEDFFSTKEFTEIKNISKNKTTAIAAGGTLLQMAKAMKAKTPKDKVYLCEISEMKKFLNQIRKETDESRINNFGIEKGRSDIFPAGICVFEYLCSQFELNDIVISPYGIRHGFLIDRYLK